jgi:hypothetical protein
VPHRNPLAVEAQHEQVLRGFGVAKARGLELVEVLRRTLGQLLDLSLGHARARPLVDQFDHFIERGLRVLLGDYHAKFKKDDDHDPALAEFRQNAMTKWEITDGPHKGAKGDTSPLHDDNYSRADDLQGHAINDQLFYSNDNPGWSSGIDKDDVLDYALTAEQMIIDTSDGNKVIEKRGPHTATIKGKDARVYGNVPKKLG